MTRQNRYTGSTAAILLVLTLVISIAPMVVLAEPQGATISAGNTLGTPTITPDSRADTVGTITTIVMSSVQQTSFWKGYVGNVSGSFTLDDGDSFTLYSWDLTGAIDGEVYVSTNGSLDWSSVSCAPIALQGTVEADINLPVSQNFNATFNSSTHDVMIVGVTTLPANTCNATVMFINDTRQPVGASQPFQEVLITDNAGNSLVYATTINDNVAGYNRNQTDFQMIVPDNTTGPLTYYFYVELDG